MSYMTPGTQGLLNKWTPKPPKKKKKMRGLGDLLQWAFAKIGIEVVVKKVEKVTGRDCGCGRRQQKLNEMVPFGSRSEDENGNVAD